MVIFRILINLFGLLLSLLAYPLFLLRQNAFALLVMAGILYVVFSFFSDDEPEPVQSYSAQLPLTSTGKAANVTSSPVLNVEDGNSMFSKDLVAAMNNEQSLFYSQVFYAVLSQVPDGTAYPWQQGDIAGSITPTETYSNSSAQTCRKFTEVLKVGVTQQNISGKACYRGDGSWCKLKLSSASGCGLHSKPSLGESFRSLF